MPKQEKATSALLNNPASTAMRHCQTRCDKDYAPCTPRIASVVIRSKSLLITPHD